jgi:hypothetical protein
MKFKNWVISQGGPKAVGRLLKVNQFTVYAWFRAQCLPRPRHIKKLVKLGNGAFSFEDILNETQESKGWK